MSQLQVEHSAIQDAANSAQGAAAAAKGHGSSEELTVAAGAVVGAQSVGYLGELGTSWDDEVAAWVSATDAFGGDLAAAGEDYRAVDGLIDGFFAGLGGGGS
ncbi:MAG: hypothetical protein LH477_16005 [Nocardioides sp.]|nr:hypothetical protein [Nocardioides sp.]